MFEIGCHVIDAMVRVLGKPNKTTAPNRTRRFPVKSTLPGQLAVCWFLTVDCGIQRPLTKPMTRAWHWQCGTLPGG